MQFRLPFLVILLIFLFITTVPGTAQSKNSLGVELKAYPAGVIFGLRGGLDIGGQNEINLWLGYNITRRGDFGEHDNEEGGGAGFGLGYRYHLKNHMDGLFLGARTDFWFMNIDWRDDNPLRQGTTDITVLQPTVEVGYDLLKQNTDWLLAPTISIGWEFNIHTKGEKVGEGAILLGGLNLVFRL